MARTILDLNSDEAFEYLTSPEHYCSIGLPKYFDFSKVLNLAKEQIVKSGDSETGLHKTVSNFDDVNYELLTNKDGRYAYRPFQIINPYLYCKLAREITKERHWEEIKERFKSFKRENIEVVSLPALNDEVGNNSEADRSTNATMIMNWWEHIEQESIILALEYKYVFITDITNCYGSLYTHTIAWALVGKATAKDKRHDKRLLCNIIDSAIQRMQNGQTNGIPQGNVLSDFIAELVLGYADMRLAKGIERDAITNYKILRYRDDYRIFSNSREELERITLKLQEILADLNFQLNSAKTCVSENIIENCIKPDKLHYISTYPSARNKNKSAFPTIQHELLYILTFSKQHPNSGSLCRLFSMLLNRLEKSTSKRFKENPVVLASITVRIAADNPKIYSYAVAVLSHFVSHISSHEGKTALLKKICNKLGQLPNCGYLEIWMQRLTLGIATDWMFKDKLCQIANSKIGVNIWNFSWLNNEETRRAFEQQSIFNKEVAKEMGVTIMSGEVSPFGY